MGHFVNKHTKIAILIAPILAVLAFAATDMFSEYQAAKKRVFAMQVQDLCDIKAAKCILSSGEFLLSFSNNKGNTVVNSNYPLDTATLFIVNNSGQPRPVPLRMNKSPYYWQAKTDLDQLLRSSGANQKLRVIANVKGGSYIGEFISTTE